MRKRGHIVNCTVEPQRRTLAGDAGWTICLPHQAGRFAVVQLTIWRKGGKQFRKTRVVASFTGAGAEAAANKLMLTLVAHGKPKPKLSLGGRMAATGRRIIARSLTATEYARASEARNEEQQP